MNFMSVTEERLCDLWPTCDFLHCPEVLQFRRVHGGDFIVSVPETIRTTLSVKYRSHDRAGHRAEAITAWGNISNWMLETGQWRSSHPVNEVSMREMSPLILVQFLKDSILEAFTAIVLIREPTPTPSQAAGNTRVCQGVCSVLISLSPCLSLGLSTFRTGSFTSFAALDSVLLHLVHSSSAGSYTWAVCHHVVICTQRKNKL